MVLTNISQVQVPRWSSTHRIPTAHLSCWNSASQNVWNIFIVPHCLFWQTQSLFTLQEGKKGTPPKKRKKNSCFKPVTTSQWLSNVKNWKGKMSSHPAPEKQQQGEINWKGNPILFILLGLKWKLIPESIPSPCPEMHNPFDTIDA